MSLLLTVLALISGGQQYTEDETTTEPYGGDGGVRNGGIDYDIILEPSGISKVSKAQIISSETLPAAGRVKYVDSGDIEVITPIGKDKYIRTIIPKESLGDDVWREEKPVYKGKYRVL